jgi:hypothetical protein
MPTHGPIHLLEPSNLLEPLDLTDEYFDATSPSVHSDDHGTPRVSRRRTPSEPLAAAAVARPTRRVLKSALIVALAVACFGAGAALPRLTSVVGINPSQLVGTANEPSARTAAAPVKAEHAKPAAMPDASTQQESSRDAPAAQKAAASDAPPRDQPPRDPQISSPNDDSSLEGSAAGPATTSAPIAAKSPEAVQPVPPARTVKEADPRHAETRASGQQEKRVRPSRYSRRAAHRDSAERRTAEGNAATARFPVQEERAPYRGSDWRRDWAGDDGAPVARSWDRWQDRATDRGWGRNAYDDYARAPDRRAFRALREDERAISRAPRDEVPVITVPPFRGGW